MVWNVPGQASSGRAVARRRLEMSYALTIVNKGGTWYISAIGPSLQTRGVIVSMTRAAVGATCTPASPQTPE